MIQVIAVNDPSSRDAFLELPVTLYQDDPLWLKSDKHSESKLAGLSDHGFFDQAESQAFLAMQGDEAVGRIVAIDHKIYSHWNPDCVGYFGFFECRRDPAIASKLFEAASRWLAQRGHDSIRGPLCPSMNYTCGCLVDGFDQLPTFGMSYNPSWYPELIESAGFQGVRDLLSFSASREMLDGIDPRIEATSRQAQDRLGIRMRHFERSIFDDEIRSFAEVFLPTARQQWGAVALMESELAPMAESLKPVTVERFTAFAELEGEPIGTVYGFPDLNPLRRKLSGHAIPADWFNHHEYRNEVKRVRLAVTLVKPQFNLWGVGPLMTWFLLEQTLADPFWNSQLEEVEYSWILDNNRLSRRTVERGGAKQTRTHRIYERAISGF